MFCIIFFEGMFAQNCIRIKVFTENFKQSDLECVVCSLMFCMRCARKYVKNYDLAYLVQSCLLINSKIQTIHFRNQWNPQHFTKLMSFDENSQITVYFCFVYFKTEIGVREGPQNLISLNRCQWKCGPSPMSRDQQRGSALSSYILGNTEPLGTSHVSRDQNISALAEKVQDKQDWKVCKIFSVWLPQKFEKNSHEIREFEYNFSVSTSIGQSPRKIPRLQFNGESENFASTRKKTFGRHWWTNSSWNDLYANSLGHEFTPKGQNWWQN